MARFGSGSSLVAVGVMTGVVWVAANAKVAAQDNAPVPDFSSNQAGWVATTGDLQPVPGSPAPVTFDPAYPYVSNQAARRDGTQPTFRIADLTNPNLKPWAKETMKRE